MRINRAALWAEHASLCETAAELRAAAHEETPDFERLGKARWHLGYLLTTHLANEDSHVYPALLRHADPHVISRAAALQAEMGDLSAQFRRYLAGWTIGEIAAAWPGFCRDTELLLDRLEERIRAEEQELYPLLERQQPVRRESGVATH